MDATACNPRGIKLVKGAAAGCYQPVVTTDELPNGICLGLFKMDGDWPMNGPRLESEMGPDDSLQPKQQPKR